MFGLLLGAAGRTGLIAALLALCAAPLTPQAPAILGGVLLDDVTGSPVAGATVTLRSLGLVAVTDSAGRFFFDRVPTGRHEVRFDADDYVSVIEEIELSEAEFLQVRLSALAAVLDELLVIVGREPASREVARTADDPLDSATGRSVLDLLEDDVPGVVVRRGGGIGGGAAIYLRGVGTFQLHTAPDIYLDGARMSQADPDAIDLLDRIQAVEVARVRVLRGAAADVTSSSANGAILIETHRGSRPDGPR